jgi:hypothetical protein
VVARSLSYRPFSFGLCWHDAVRCNGGTAEMVLNAFRAPAVVRQQHDKMSRPRDSPAESGVARFAAGLAARRLAVGAVAWAMTGWRKRRADKAKISARSRRPGTLGDPYLFDAWLPVSLRSSDERFAAACTRHVRFFLTSAINAGL